MAVNPWVGYEADAYVVGTLMETELGCTVNYKELKEDVSWQGFGTGEVDVVIEDWGHPDLEKKFFADSGDGTATSPQDRATSAAAPLAISPVLVSAATVPPTTLAEAPSRPSEPTGKRAKLPPP